MVRFVTVGGLEVLPLTTHKIRPVVMRIWEVPKMMALVIIVLNEEVVLWHGSNLDKC